MKETNNKNIQFFDSLYLNNTTFQYYLYALKRLALSIFEWVNLPKSMNAMFLEKCLYYEGQAGLLKDKNYGFINTKVADNGDLNIYHLPTKLNCYSFNYQTYRTTYTGIDGLTEEQRKAYENYHAILVQNNWDREPTSLFMELFAYRLYAAERTCDTNINAQKTPVMILVDEKQRFLMENLYSQYDGNRPFIFGDKKQLEGTNLIQAINTQAPFVADKIMDYKKEIWNEALTFLGINNIMIDKKERLVSDEANSNNEVINLNLQSFLAPRQYACKQFNEKFGFTGTDKEISVRVRSDLHNVIKNTESIINDYKDLSDLQNNIDDLKTNGGEE